MKRTNWEGASARAKRTLQSWDKDANQQDPVASHVGWPGSSPLVILSAAPSASELSRDDSLPNTATQSITPAIPGAIPSGRDPMNHWPYQEHLENFGEL